MTQNRTVKWLGYVAGTIGMMFASCLAAPQLLAFPHVATIGTTRVYAETPIDEARMAAILHAADARLAASPLYDEPVGTRVFLTDGGWRWRALALNTSGAFALTRSFSSALSDAVIIGRHSITQNHVYNSQTIGGVRRLSDIIAHERTHIMMERSIGWLADKRLPRWKREGYADYVAGSSSLSAGDVARLRAQGAEHPALLYYEGRRRVAAALATNGGDVGALLLGD
ncbi:MAG: hypothetical protein ABL874_04025 [Sphingopyxis sp.]